MFEQFKNTIGLEEDQWQDYSSCFKRMQVPAKTSLLTEGQISKKLFLIEKGCMREKHHIISRIPQHYIAPYLGISAVHLSRIKNLAA